MYISHKWVRYKLGVHEHKKINLNFLLKIIFISHFRLLRTNFFCFQSIIHIFKARAMSNFSAIFALCSCVVGETCTLLLGLLGLRPREADR